MLTSEGHRLLREAAKGRGRRAAIARAIGKSRPTVCDLVNGKHDPALETAVALKQHLGIPVEAWSQKPRRNSKAA